MRRVASLMRDNDQNRLQHNDQQEMELLNIAKARRYKTVEKSGSRTIDLMKQDEERGKAEFAKIEEQKEQSISRSKRNSNPFAAVKKSPKKRSRSKSNDKSRIVSVTSEL
jgi:hypothetical protein